MREQVVVFRAGDDFYGVELDCVREVIPVHEVIIVPDASGAADGFVYLREDFLPLVDFRKRTGVFCRENCAGQWIMVISGGNRQVGMLVDAVIAMAELAKERVAPLRSQLRTGQSKYLRGFGQFHGQKLPLVSPDSLAGHCQAGGAGLVVS